MKRNFILFCLIIAALLFIQCKSSQLGKIEKLVNKVTDITFFDMKNFDRGRKLMFGILPANIIENDSIIIVERYTDMPSANYSFSIYESWNKKNTSYVAKAEIINGEAVLTSLIPLNIEDHIMPLVLEHKFEEIIKRGNAAMLTPSSVVLISIITKNHGRYEIETFRTNYFY